MQVYLESYRGSEPAGLHGLRKQVTEAKERSWELRKKRGRGKSLGGRTRERREDNAAVLQRGCARELYPFIINP